LLKKADIIPAQFSQSLLRNQVSDSLLLLPQNKLICFLSCPQTRIENNPFSIFQAFSTFVWILILLSFLLVYYINSLKTNKTEQKLTLAIDYISIILGKGIGFKFDKIV